MPQSYVVALTLQLWSMYDLTENEPCVDGVQLRVFR